MNTFNRKAVDAVVAANLTLSGKRIRNDKAGEGRAVKYQGTVATQAQMDTIVKGCYLLAPGFAYAASMKGESLVIEVTKAVLQIAAPKVVKKEGKLTMAKVIRAAMSAVLTLNPKADVAALVEAAKEAAPNLGAKLHVRYVKNNLPKVKLALGIVEEAAEA